MGAGATAMFSISSGIKQVAFAIPASIFFAFGAIYTLAAAGVSTLEIKLMLVLMDARFMSNILII